MVVVLNFSRQFIAVRKTLEASMQSSHMYPPGRVLWAMRDSDLHAVHRSQPSSDTSGDDKLRLFEVLDVEQVFKQIVFARDMLRYGFQMLFQKGDGLTAP